MADTFKFDLVSPERLLVSANVEQVVVPGSEGDFTMLPHHAPVLTGLRPGVLAGHAPMLATLRPGILVIHGDGGPKRMVVLGGFAEVSAEGLTVVADLAETVENIDKAMVTSRIGEMEERIAKMEPGSELDKVITRLDQFRQVNRHLTGTAMH